MKLQTTMGSDDEDNHQSSEEDIDDATHAKLIDNVLNLSNKRRVKKPTRTEPTIKISEFDLVSPTKTVALEDLAKSLKTRGKQAGLKTNIINKQAETLPRPLEKPQADRIRRETAYKTVSTHLARWDPIVTSNRAATQLKFPLADLSETREKVRCEWRVKSDLEKKLEEVEPKVEVIEVEDKFPMTMKEMLEKRKEMAKMRAQQSYAEAKARRHNKIKSKKFHRIERRERTKQQLKEFELLQKTDPEAALKKLEEIERARAEERVSLRHKSTGKWARNKQIRAKYDKDSRAVLAQQLAVSRDLTQKITNNDSDSDENENKEETINAKHNIATSGNPWINESNIKVTKEVDDFVSGYRRFWEEKNKENLDVDGTLNDVIKTDKKKLDGSNENLNIVEIVDSIEHMNNTSLNESDDVIEEATEEFNKTSMKNKTVKRKKNCSLNSSAVSTSDWDVTIVDDEDVSNIEDTKRSKTKEREDNVQNSSRKKLKKRINAKNKEKQLEVLAREETHIDIDKEFDLLEHKLQTKVKNKLTKISNKPEKVINLKIRKREETSKSDLSLPKKATRPEIDEPLDENAHLANANDDIDLDKIKAILTAPEKNHAANEDIDPNKFVNVKPTKLNSSLPDILGYDDNEPDDDQRDVITEAFQDDDIVDQFRKDKRAEADKDNPADIDLSLPGWGSWGGKDVPMPKRKRRRFIVKLPKKKPRKDANKGNVIIDESGNDKVRPHRVSEVPFPFTAVKDFEASIRAPIGSTFVPETAFRRLTRPDVLTKMGTIIEPMSEDVLLKKVS